MKRIVLLGAAAAGLVTGIVLFTVMRGERPRAGTPSAATAPAPSVAPAAEAPASSPRTPEPSSPVPSSSARRRTAVPPPAEPRPAPADAAPELGTLRIEADVDGAQVFIDRRFIGTAPVTAHGLTPGTHQLNVSAPGFDGIAQPIDVEPGPRELSVRLRQVRLDASVAVVHKHRFGSCTGQLVATPDGVRYETANREDGFSSPLEAVESLQVDYQARNLRIKLRGGREYNFTDPEGDADRLFVFHRDVERARERLAQGGER
jgi:hypothetical protein